MALDSGLTNPVAGLDVVVLDALADGVEVTELELRFRVAVIGGLPIPCGSQCMAERDALARVVEIG